MKNEKKQKLTLRKRMARLGLNLFFYSALLISLLLFMRIFIFSSFRIPTDSMEPEVLPGDYVLVNKLLYGARLFDIFEVAEGKKTAIYRLPGLGRIKRNDVLVFHFPHPQSWNKIEMNMLSYYLKRCIALPGDTLSIEAGMYRIKGREKEKLGNTEAQKTLAEKAKESLPKAILQTWPFQAMLQWDIHDFGPLYLPRKGDEMLLGKKEQVLYKKIIEWEIQAPLHIKNDTLWQQNSLPLCRYRFKQNYYFMAGDQVANSQDSRYWGLLPEEFIVGKAWMVWKSEDAKHKIRWKRIFKKIR